MLRAGLILGQEALLWGWEERRLEEQGYYPRTLHVLHSAEDAHMVQGDVQQWSGMLNTLKREIQGQGQVAGKQLSSLEEDVGKRFSSLEEKADLRMEDVGKRFSSLEEGEGGPPDGGCWQAVL